MALYEVGAKNGIRWAIWKIEEQEDFFYGKLNYFSKESLLPNRRIQFLASRYLFHILNIDFTRIEKDEFNRPYDKMGENHFSISHCAGYAAVAISSGQRVGVDVEEVREKVIHIAPKFLYPDEYAGATIEKLMIAWSAKESLFKLWGSKGVDFKKHLILDAFTPCVSGVFGAQISMSSVLHTQVEYRLFDNHVFTFAREI